MKIQLIIYVFCHRRKFLPFTNSDLVIKFSQEFRAVHVKLDQLWHRLMKKKCTFLLLWPIAAGIGELKSARNAILEWADLWKFNSPETITNDDTKNLSIQEFIFVHDCNDSDQNVGFIDSVIIKQQAFFELNSELHEKLFYSLNALYMWEAWNRVSRTIHLFASERIFKGFSFNRR